MKFQIPNHNFQTNLNDQKSNKSNTSFGHWRIGILKLFGIWILVLVICFSCGSAVNQGENFGDLLQSPEGLVLTEQEHEIGWGRTDCTTCHNLENIHLVNRSTIDIDIESIHNQALQEGISGCAACHGTNGAP